MWLDNSFIYLRVIALVQRFVYARTDDNGVNDELLHHYYIPVTFRNVILNAFHTRKAHFGTALRPMVFLFMPVGHIATAATLVTQPKYTLELRKHTAHALLLLAEKLGRG